MYDQEEIQAQLNLAASFFAKDYQERSMVKWQGFFLSDHTEDVAKYKQHRTTDSQRQDHVEMSEEAISQYLLKAFDQQFSVTIQLKNHDDKGMVSPLYHGKVLGYQGNNVVLSNNVNTFPLADILYVS